MLLFTFKMRRYDKGCVNNVSFFVFNKSLTSQQYNLIFCLKYFAIKNDSYIHSPRITQLHPLI